MHFEDWGKVSEITIGRNYKGMMKQFKNMAVQAKKYS